MYESDRPHVMLGQNVTRLDVLLFDLMLNRFDFVVWMTLIEIPVENIRLLISPSAHSMFVPIFEFGTHLDKAHSSIS